MNLRLLADENTSKHLVAACRQLRPDFPIRHLSDWDGGAYRSLHDTALLLTLRDQGMVLVSFDRSTLPFYAGGLTRQGVGHSGVILFRRSVSTLAYGRQARLLVDLMAEAVAWDWADRIEYLPRP
jgi:hypothetical protein